MTSRRKFIADTAKLTTILSLPITLQSSKNREGKVNFGVIADVHHDLIPDGESRLQAFITDASQKSLDFIIQLGDFCMPIPENQPFVALFNNYSGEKHHVLGNHDMDGGFSREQTRSFWSMNATYYSFNHKGIHFVILDGNDPNPQPFEGYHRYIGPDQMRWLKSNLEKSLLPSVIFSHQTFENEDGGIANMSEVRALLEAVNNSVGYTKVLACLCGHHHTDYYTRINDIYYIQINSASYRWVGDQYKLKRFPDDVHKRYKWLEYTIPYKSPLYTFVSIDLQGWVTIESSQSAFVGPGPSEMGMPAPPVNDPIVPFISEMKLRIP